MRARVTALLAVASTIGALSIAAGRCAAGSGGAHPAGTLPGSALPGDAASQDEAPEAEESQLEKFLRLAQSGSAVVRPQAAQKLVGLGQPAVAALKELLAEPDTDLAGLGTELTEVLADFGDAELRATLWAALDDPDFPWRPAAARGLSKKPLPGEGERFVSALSDPIATVREPAIGALERLDQRGATAALQGLLNDPDDRVRRMAARTVFRWGNRCALMWIVEDLKREDRWFELQTGKLARYQALRMLEDGLDGHLRRKFDFRAEKSWDDPANAKGRKKIEDFVERVCPEPPELPPVARAAAPTEGDVLGLEIRSCRKGEYFLRWNQDDVLLVGTGNAVRVELPAGTVAQIMAAATEGVAELGDERLWGEPGCDTEQLVFRPDVESRSTSFRVSKGQEFVPGIRPEALARLELMLLATLPEDGDDPRTEDLRARVREALCAVGGDLPAE